MRMTEGPHRVGEPILSLAQRPPPFPLQHFNPLFPITSRAEKALQPGGVGKLEEGVV